MTKKNIYTWPSYQWYENVTVELLILHWHFSCEVCIITLKKNRCDLKDITKPNDTVSRNIPRTHKLLIATASMTFKISHGYKMFYIFSWSWTWNALCVQNLSRNAKSKLSRPQSVVWWTELLSRIGPPPKFHLYPWRHICLSRVIMQISHELQQLQ